MKKIILALLFVLLFAPSLLAGKWVSRGYTFHQGFYMLCNVTDPEIPPHCAIVDTEGTVQEVDDFVKSFNDDGIDDSQTVYWFYWDIDSWLKIIPPFKYVKEGGCQDCK